MKRFALAASLALAVAVGGLAGALLQGHSAIAQTPPYKVLQSDPKNAAQLEKLLNEQAGAGWKYLTDIDKKLFIFEKR